MGCGEASCVGRAGAAGPGAPARAGHGQRGAAQRVCRASAGVATCDRPARWRGRWVRRSDSRSQRLHPTPPLACACGSQPFNLAEATTSGRHAARDAQRAGELIAQTRSLLSRSNERRDWFDLAATIRAVLAVVRTGVCASAHRRAGFPRSAAAGAGGAPADPAGAHHPRRERDRRHGGRIAAPPRAEDPLRKLHAAGSGQRARHGPGQAAGASLRRPPSTCSTACSRPEIAAWVSGSPRVARWSKRPAASSGPIRRRITVRGFSSSFRCTSEARSRCQIAVATCLP